MKKIINYSIKGLLTCCMIIFSACSLDIVVDPNNPSLGSVLNNASKAELQTLVSGLEAGHRDYFTNATQMFGCFGREVWAYFASDPRFASDWLGVGISATYQDFFASAGTYVDPYQAVKQANVLIQSVGSTTVVTAQEANGYTGFAKTIKAYQLIWPLMQQYQNGIRTDVSDPLNPGPTQTYAQALATIRTLLDEGRTDLQNAGSSFSFTLTSGFSGFNTPAGLILVNRAIAARLALYASDNVGALTALTASFMNLGASTAAAMNVGPAHVWGNSPDIPNPLFYPRNQVTSTILIVHPALIQDALPGDARIPAKFYQRTNLVTSSGIKDGSGNNIPGEYQDNRYTGVTSPTPFIRNEELMLIYAEANIGTNTAAVTTTINAIRNTWGVGNYTGGTTNNQLLEEILFQRRYSLWAEGGHRWIDLRRTGKLDAAHVDLRDQGTLFTQVARRTSETNWDANN